MFKISENSLIAIQILEDNGFEAYLAGGCVRDLIMNITPHDWDITTSCPPNTTLDIFARQGYRTITTGLKHGTVTVLINNEPLEITTFRKESTYSDMRRPDRVEFVISRSEDIKRRDFTMNALLYNPRTGVIDEAGGINDIKNKIIRCVGNPDMRFSEDALRILRAIRFSSVLGFEIDADTSDSLIRNKSRLRFISEERKREELNKLLLGNDVKYVLFKYSEILEIIIPEIHPMIGFDQNNPHHCYDVWVHTIEALAHSPKDLKIRLALLLHDIGKPESCELDSYGISHFISHPEKSTEIAREVMVYLRYSNSMIDTVTTLIKYHDFRFIPSEKSIKKMLVKIGEENLRLLLDVRKADILAQNRQYLPEKMALLDQSREILDKVINEQQCFTKKDLCIDGNDLMSLSIPQGKSIGLILNRLLEMVINNELPNEKKRLLNEAAKIWTDLSH